MNISQKLYDAIVRIVNQVLNDQNLLQGHWHLGKVDSVVSSTMLKVFVDGSTSSQSIPCNPNVTFSAGQEVWVHYVNGNVMNKFVPYRRGI